MTEPIDDIYHAILDHPWKYEVTGFCYSRELHDWRSPRVDLTLQRGDSIRRL